MRVRPCGADVAPVALAAGLLLFGPGPAVRQARAAPMSVPIGIEGVALWAADLSGPAVARVAAGRSAGVAWVLDERDALGASVVAGRWRVRFDSPSLAQRVAVARAFRPPGEVPRVTFTVRAAAGSR